MKTSAVALLLSVLLLLLSSAQAEDRATLVKFALNELSLPHQKPQIVSFITEEGPLTYVTTMLMNLRHSNGELRQYEVEIQRSKQRGTIKLIGALWHHLPESTTSDLIRDKRSTNDTVRVQTYNIWNFDGDWPVRKHIIAKIVQEQNPDVIAWQEIRQKDGQINELTQLNELIPGYHYMYIQSMKFTDTDDHEEEGLGIFIRDGTRVLSRRILRMSHQDCGDLNTRSAILLTLYMEGKTFDFVATHWSYDSRCQILNALNIYNFTAGRLLPLLLLGDLNIVADYTIPTDILTGKNQDPQYPNGTFVDIWEMIHPGDVGWTFPSGVKSAPDTRCDRILARPGKRYFFQPLDARIVAFEPFYNETDPTRTVPDPLTQAFYSSDHKSVVGEYRLTKRAIVPK